MVKMLIGGEQTDATATDELEVVDPATEDVYETVPAGGAGAVDLAVQAAAARSSSGRGRTPRSAPSSSARGSTSSPNARTRSSRR